MNKFFNDSFGTMLSVDRISQEIFRFMSEDKDRKYKIIIGSDSDGHNEKRIDFVTAIVVYRVGNGGRYFWRRVDLPKFHTLRERIIQEVLFSIETAKEVLTTLEKFNLPELDFEIHIDVGENGKTKALIQEVTGMVRAYNFEARTKPESYAATNIADRHT